MCKKEKMSMALFHSKVIYKRFCLQAAVKTCFGLRDNKQNSIL